MIFEVDDEPFRERFIKKIALIIAINGRLEFRSLTKMCSNLNSNKGFEI